MAEPSGEIVKACEVCSGVGWLPSTDPYLDHARPRCEACGGSGRPDERTQTVKWCVTHDRPARGFVAAVCPNEASCNVVDLPAAYFGSPHEDRCPHGFPSGGWDCCRHDPSLDDHVEDT